MEATHGAWRQRQNPAAVTPSVAQNHEGVELDAARSKLTAALFDRLGGRKAQTHHETEDLQRRADSAANDLIRRIAGPNLDLTDVSYVQSLPLNAWSALQRYALAENGVGIRQLTVGPGVNFLDGNLLQGLAQLELRCVRSQALIKRSVGERLFKSLSRLETVHSRDGFNQSPVVTMNHGDFQTPQQNLRRGVRKTWAAFDHEINRKTGQTPSTILAVNAIIAHAADMPWSAIERGLQSALIHTIDTGSDAVTRGIARAVLGCEESVLPDDRKISLLTGGPTPDRTRAAHVSALRIHAQAAATDASAPKPSRHFRSALNSKGEAEASRKTRQGKMFVPALGAFIEDPMEELDEPDELDQPFAHAQPIRPPLLHALVAETFPMDADTHSLALRYAGIGNLIGEIAASNLEDAAIDAIVACVHLTTNGPMTWAQAAMSSGHPGAVGNAIVAILNAYIDADSQRRFITALGVNPRDVVAALKDAQRNDGEWAERLVRRIEQGLHSPN